MSDMFAFARTIDFPTTLSEVEGFSQAHIDRALTAAKNPQLKMKLENMPIPLTAEMIDEYMGPILETAKSGDLSLTQKCVNHRIKKQLKFGHELLGNFRIYQSASRDRRPG